MAVVREFLPFDEKIISKEFAKLPSSDYAKLAALVEFYETSVDKSPYPVQIDSYGQGIFRLRHAKPNYQGRLLFCIDRLQRDKERLIILCVFKKEGEKVPNRILKTAIDRQAKWFEKGNNNDLDSKTD